MPFGSRPQRSNPCDSKRAVAFTLDVAVTLRMLLGRASKESEMSCYNSCVVSASADDVWRALRVFHQMPWAPSVIESVDVVGDVPDGEPGAKRILNGLFHETLRAVDDDSRTLTYTVEDGPEPLSKDTLKGYTGVVRVRPVSSDGTAFVEWSSSWDESEGGVAEFCNPVYQALLSDLQAHFA